jgi:hypothetical protein
MLSIDRFRTGANVLLNIQSRHLPARKLAVDDPPDHVQGQTDQPVEGAEGQG